MASAVTVFPLISRYSSISWNTGFHLFFHVWLPVPAQHCFLYSMQLNLQCRMWLPFFCCTAHGFTIHSKQHCLYLLCSLSLSCYYSCYFSASTIFKTRLNVALDGIFVIPNLFSRNSFLFSA